MKHFCSTRVARLFIFLGFLWSIVHAFAYCLFYDYVGEFTDALSQGDTDTFASVLWKVVATQMVGCLAMVMLLYTGERLLLVLEREKMTEWVHRLYFGETAAFRISQLDGRVVDADQRIAQDIRSFFKQVNCIVFGTPMYLGVLPVLAMSVWFSVAIVQRVGWISLAMALGFFIVFAVIGQVFIVRSQKLAENTAFNESVLSFSHTYIRLHAESITMLRGESNERARVDSMLEKVLTSVKQEAFWHIFLNFNANFLYWGAGAVAYFIPALQHGWQGDTTAISIGDFISVGGMIASLLYNLSYTVMLTSEISTLMAHYKRIMGLLNALYTDNLIDVVTHKEGQVYEMKAREMIIDDQSCISFEKVILKTPTGVMLFPGGISFEVNVGDRVLIAGPSGCGKTSLIRALAGLWPVQSGTISKPRTGIFYMPQRPYLTYGTLRELIAYPSSANVISNAVTLDLLKQVQLPYTNIDTAQFWPEILSTGEQQRVGFARLLFHKPAFVVLDECSSAIDEDLEAEMYEAVIATGAGILSIAHRSSVKRFHQSTIQISKDGGWSLNQ